MIASFRRNNFIAIFASCALAVLFNGEPQGGFAQCISCSSAAMSVLGSHNNSGRGCASCHVLHTLCASATGTTNHALWSRGAADCATIRIDKNGCVLKGAEKATAINPEVAEVLLCLSCHDGNIAKENMTANESYEEFGLGTKRARMTPPTMRDTNGWIHSPGHPLGPNAVINTGHGLQFAKGQFSVVPGSPYSQFVANYGWPTLAPTSRARRFGVTDDGRPYVLCTTCHNQHGTNEYTSRPESPIAGDGGGYHYVALYSLNGPYNPDTHNGDGRMATSNVQFCRQCHFELSNEANNVYGIHTLF